MKDLCCGQLEKYYLPHLSNRIESLRCKGLGDNQIFLEKSLKILFWKYKTQGHY